MQEFLPQVILASRGEDSEGWMNILFVVVLAVFWVVSSIIKAATKKPEGGKRELSSRVPARTPSALTKLTKAREPSPGRPVGPGQARPQHRPAARAAEQQSHAARLTAGLEKAFRSKIMEAIPKLESSLPKPSVEPVLQENHPEFPSKPLKEPEHNRLGGPQRTTEAKDLPEREFDFADPDELSKAILHYEILGPPVSMRNPSQHI